MQPDLHIGFEQSLGNIVCGVDEAGRGPLAGPVIAAAVILRADAIPKGIADSKKLSSRARERLHDLILVQSEVGIGEASVEEIDRLNILHASLLAMKRAVEALPSHASLCLALIDGNQRAPLNCPQQTLVGGDARCLSIAAASIIAKVTRDRLMQRYAVEYPQYGFERHAGYGTSAHMKALSEYGPTPLHRRSFAPVQKLLKASA
jgi:ribonuclease HII